MGAPEDSSRIHEFDRLLGDMGLGPLGYGVQSQTVDESMRRLGQPAQPISTGRTALQPHSEQSPPASIEMQLKLAETESRNLEFQSRMLDTQSRMQRSRTVGNVANVLKWPAMGATVLAAGYFVMNYLFPGGPHGSAPSHKLPDPTTAFAKLDSADTLIFATGEVSEVSNVTVRATLCSILDLICQDLHAGHDVSTTVQSPVQYSIDGGQIKYGVIKGPDKKPIAFASIRDNEIAQDLVNPVVTHPVADTQFAADLVGTVGVETGVGGVLDLGTAQTEYNLRVQAAELVMEAGEEPGDAMAGAIAQQARKDIGRLAGLLDATDPESAKVVRDLIADGNPIAVDFGPDGIEIPPPAPVEEIHFSKMGMHLDVDFDNAKDMEVSKQVNQTIAEWLNPQNVYIIRHHGKTSKN